MTDTDKKSTSSRELKYDTEKASDSVDLNQNIAAKYVSSRFSSRLYADDLSRIKNPLAGIPKAQLLNDVERFAAEKDMTDITDLLKKGALVAQDPASFESIEELDEDEKTALRREITHKWSQPRVLYLTVILCSIGAAVQYVFHSFLNPGFDS